MSALGRAAFSVFLVCLALGWLGVGEWWLASAMVIAFLVLCWTLREPGSHPTAAAVMTDHPKTTGAPVAGPSRQFPSQAGAPVPLGSNHPQGGAS